MSEWPIQSPSKCVDYELEVVRLSAHVDSFCVYLSLNHCFTKTDIENYRSEKQTWETGCNGC